MSTNISAIIEIAATPERVWAVLTDLASYEAWNPVFCKAAGEFTVGNYLTLTTIQPRNGRTMTVKVKVVAATPAAELRWKSSLLLGLSSSKRAFILGRDGDSGTELTQTGSYQGLFTTFSYQTVGRIQTSFEAINQAVKEQAEALS
jgi:hypothetical protein